MQPLGMTVEARFHDGRLLVGPKRVEASVTGRKQHQSGAYYLSPDSYGPYSDYFPPGDSFDYEARSM